ncbi:hypothetical protein [Rufibacter aurantiacus]|uniref:hypothetical protein n=1 Tax=Rufibacter aurantiacus TaxID=2817374 RepID=UPI001B309A77|nr:hypothetical protein [Rufibacter aurantiacus]
MPWYFVIPALSLFILINYNHYRFIISNGEKMVRMEFGKMRLPILKIRRTGLFSTGDFKKSLFVIRPVFPGGNFSLQHYRYIDFLDATGKQKTITVKIKWHLFKKLKLEFKPSLEKFTA